MRRVFFERIGNYAGRKFRILKLSKHGKRHFWISGPALVRFTFDQDPRDGTGYQALITRLPDFRGLSSPSSGSLASSSRGMGKIGIRREDALVYERRSPLIPSHVGELVKQGLGIHLSLSEFVR